MKQRMNKKRALIILVAGLAMILALLLYGIARHGAAPSGGETQSAAGTDTSVSTTVSPGTTAAATQPTEPETTTVPVTTAVVTEPETTPPTTQPETTPPTTEPEQTAPPTTEPPAPTTEPAETTQPPTKPEDSDGKILVVIDPGHQRRGNYDKEPIGPGASETKAKVTSGTQGKFTGLEEYVLNLNVSLMLRDILEQRGYEVLMVRTHHDVDISNAERAEIANQANADVFVRIHANGSDDTSVSGMLTICQTKNNPYNAHLYELSKKLSRFVLDEMAATTGGTPLKVWETDTMSGINWCNVPVTIVEMGYMSNEKEDRLMATEEYQLQLAEGIANGIDEYCAVVHPRS